MSDHYLFDISAPTILTAPIREIRRGVSSSPVLGSFVVRVPDGLDLGPTPPTDFQSLVTAKVTARLAYYAGFAAIASDELAESPSIDPFFPSGSMGVQVGERGSGVRILPGGSSFFTSTLFPLVSTPAQAIFTWEVYSITHADYRDNYPVKTYTEMSPNLTCVAAISFNGGTNYTPATDGALVNISPGIQGNSLKVGIENTGAGPIYVASWSLVY